MKCCAQTFPPIFRLFVIFDGNFAKIVAPPDDDIISYCNYNPDVTSSTLPPKYNGFSAPVCLLCEKFG